MSSLSPPRAHLSSLPHDVETAAAAAPAAFPFGDNHLDVAVLSVGASQKLPPTPTTTKNEKEPPHTKTKNGPSTSSPPAEASPFDIVTLDLLKHIFSFVGYKQYRFVAGVKLSRSVFTVTSDRWYVLGHMDII